MKVTVMRIDDRLIHGQIVTRWIDYAEAKKILVVDDKAAADSMQQMLLKLAVPSGITLEHWRKSGRIRAKKKCCSLCAIPLRRTRFWKWAFPSTVSM